MKTISSLFHLFLALFLLAMGLLFFTLPLSQKLASLFFLHQSLFSLLGLTLLLFGFFFLMGASSAYFHPSLTLKVSSYELSLNLIQESLQRYCEKLFPQKKMEIEVFLKRKQRLEIVVHLEMQQILAVEDPFLQSLKKEIKQYLSGQFDYHRTFFLTIVS